MLQRTDVLHLLDTAFPDQPIVLTLGGTIREMLAVVGRKPNHLYSLDAMGQTIPLALGLAIGLEGNPKHDKVIVVEGDGSLLMGFSVLSTSGYLAPTNLVAVVLDNGVYLATGGQPTAASTTDFVQTALACGWTSAFDVEGSAEAVAAAFERAHHGTGPTLLRIQVGTEQPKTDFFLEDPVLLARQFQDWLNRR